LDTNNRDFLDHDVGRIVLEYLRYSNHELEL
jgi:hypothetical protein